MRIEPVLPLFEVPVTFDPKLETAARRQLIRVLSGFPSDVSMELLKMIVMGTFEGSVNLHHVGALTETAARVTGKETADVASEIGHVLSMDDAVHHEGIDQMQKLLQSVHFGDKISHDREEIGCNHFVEAIHGCCLEALQSIEEVETRVQATRLARVSPQQKRSGVIIPVQA